MQHKLLRVLFALFLVVALYMVEDKKPAPKKSVLSAAPTAAPIVQLSTASAMVVSVVDGDTIHVENGPQKETIRLIGVDTPELHDPRKPVGCFAKEAKEKVASLINGKEVILEADSTQSNRDIYGRLLRYVFLDGVLVNRVLIAEGYGYEYTYDEPYTYQQVFKDAQKEAQEQQKGLWNPATCPTKK